MQDSSSIIIIDDDSDPIDISLKERLKFGGEYTSIVPKNE